MEQVLVSSLVGIFVLFAASQGLAQVDPRLHEGPTAIVVEVVDGDTVILDDGSQVRLVNIQTPKLALGREDFEEQPLAHEAKAALEEAVLNRQVTLAFDQTQMDRHGRWLAHLYRDDGLWLQGHMVDIALARVYSFPDNRIMASELLAREADARALDAGIWALSFYAVREAGDPDAVPVDSYELVEGHVVDAAEVNGRVFLNFGDDWKSDVTATVSPEDARLFDTETIDLASLAGQRIRVRGWVNWHNGPSISVSHPEQIEVLE
ncbi:MAG: thermonuclease family protein [Pseudomonadota bacterium]